MTGERGKRVKSNISGLFCALIAKERVENVLKMQLGRQKGWEVSLLQAHYPIMERGTI